MVYQLFDGVHRSRFPVAESLLPGVAAHGAAVARTGPSSALRLRRNGAHPAPHTSDRPGTAVWLIAPANDEGPMVSTCLPAALVSPQEAPCLA